MSELLAAWREPTTIATVEQAKEMLQLYTNRKGGPQDFRDEAAKLKEKVDQMVNEELKEECKRLMKQMHKTFVAKTQSSWRPFVLCILHRLGTSKSDLESLLPTKKDPSLALFEEFESKDSNSLKKIIREKVKLVSPQITKEERERKAREEEQRLLLDKRRREREEERLLTPKKSKREADNSGPEDRIAREEADRLKAAENAERTKAFNRSYMQQHRDRVAAQEDEPIIEIISELEKLSELLLPGTATKQSLTEEERRDIEKVDHETEQSRHEVPPDANVFAAPGGNRRSALKKQVCERVDAEWPLLGTVTQQSLL